MIDFGLSKELRGKRVRDREKIGTFTYMPPEVLQGIYSTKCDMWSAGIVLMILITGRNSFKGKSKEETFERIKRESISFAGTCHPIQETAGEASLQRLRKW